jgi:hypothetical protein
MSYRVAARGLCYLSFSLICVSEDFRPPVQASPFLEVMLVSLRLMFHVRIYAHVEDLVSRPKSLP